MAKGDKFWAVIDAISESMEEEERRRKEEAESKREGFENEVKTFNRGTVIAAMAKMRFSQYDIKSVVDVVETSEQAEAAVGLIEAGYSAFDTKIIVRDL